MIREAHQQHRTESLQVEMLENLPLYSQFLLSQEHQAEEEACQWPERAEKRMLVNFMCLNSSEEQEVNKHVVCTCLGHVP